MLANNRQGNVVRYCIYGSKAIMSREAGNQKTRPSKQQDLEGLVLYR